jgi:hypothetical protein
VQTLITDTAPAFCGVKAFITDNSTFIQRRANPRYRYCTFSQWRADSPRSF